MDKKIAIFHNFLDNIGGAEMVVFNLARELNADVYTTNIDRENIRKMGFEDVLPRVYSIGKVPINAPYRHQMALWRFRRLDLEGYDYYIIAGDWAYSATVNNKPNLWYIHSPARELFDLNEYIRNNIVSWWKRPIFDVWVRFNKYLINKYLPHVNKIVCNSKNTQSRINKYLNKEAKVINPPIDPARFKNDKNKGYWLSVNRLFFHKRVDLQLKAFSKLPNEKLIMIGSYEDADHFEGYAKQCIENKPDNVKMLHWVDRKELIDLYANCKGFITTAMDEDFGITPIEAMAAGKPVIAPNEGGYKETITNKTGKLINNISVKKLIKSIKQLGRELTNNPNKYKKACQVRARQYGINNFIKEINSQLKRL